MNGPTRQHVQFSPTSAAVLAAVADTLIPGTDGFPAPSEQRIVEDFMCRYVDTSESPAYPPAITDSEIELLVHRLGDEFGSVPATARVDALIELESAEPDLFARLRMLVYAGYYSRPGVRSAISALLPAGRDFRGTPQPRGYADVIEPWEPALLNHHGSYVATEDVAPVDPDKRAALLAAYAAERNGEPR